jgi:hypothetical protein
MIDMKALITNVFEKWGETTAIHKPSFYCFTGYLPDRLLWG